MSFWSDKAVLVTGGAGFIGSHLVEKLLHLGAKVKITTRNRSQARLVFDGLEGRVDLLEGDLTSRTFTQKACVGIDAVFNLAAEVAGVGYNSIHPGTIFTSNMALGLNVLDAAAREGVERFLCVSSACVYQRFCTVPTPEKEGFLGDPEPTNLGYGWAKRALEVQATCYAEEFPMKIGIARPYNAYGPRDNFEWETSHVIAALIRKVVEGNDPVEVWGDGSQTRSFLYVSDFVEGLLLILERHAVCDPVNIGTDEEVTIADLVQMIVKIAGSAATIRFDASRAAGQPRRIGDLSKAKDKLGFRPAVGLEEGLDLTIRWYRDNLA